MILIDYSQISYSCFFAMPEEDRQEDILRHVIYQTILATKKKFSGKRNGPIVIAADGSNSWRKKKFPHYKARRAKAKHDDSIDWSDVFRIFNIIRDEFRNYFPYKFVCVDEAEGDDVIATLIRTFIDESHVIISSDKDFKQLHGTTSKPLLQWDPIHKKYVNAKDFDKLEFILKGDVGDGIPNVLTEDDVFINGGRQKPMTKKRLQELRMLPMWPSNENYGRFKRNMALMDLEKIPVEIQDKIIIQFNKEREPKSTLFDLFMSKGLKRLMEKIDDFEERLI